MLAPEFMFRLLESSRAKVQHKTELARFTGLQKRRLLLPRFLVDPEYRILFLEPLDIKIILFSHSAGQLQLEPKPEPPGGGGI